MTLAPHLTWQEILANSGVASPDELPPGVRPAIETMAAQLWTPLRQAWGNPLRVVSGYRSPEVNRAAGGKPRSQHLVGRALDLVPSDRDDMVALYDVIDGLMRRGEIPQGWLCIYRLGTPGAPGSFSFCHADMRGSRPRGGSHVDGRRTSFRRRTPQT